MKKTYFLIFFISSFGFCQNSILPDINEIKKIEFQEINLLKEIKKKKNDSLKVIEESYKKKFGITTYNKLKLGKYWIGMTKEMAIFSLGTPSDINRTVTKNSVSEQWVYYNSIYLYFINGILNSFQD